MALLEAMAAGIPVAVTAVGGNPEVVVKDQTGWVVPSDSVEALTDVLLEAVNDPENDRRSRVPVGSASKTVLRSII